MNQAIEECVNLELSSEDAIVVEAGLRLMLMVEDDHAAIVRLKGLLERVNWIKCQEAAPAS
jgi:hypothetical protein